MKALLLSLALVVCVAGSSRPACAQAPAAPPAIAQVLPAAQLTEWRLAPARHAIPTGPARLKEATGVLISDPQGKQIRFEAKDGAGFVVPYERINAMHYEEWNYPRRAWRKSSFYLTVHYSDVAGRPAFETIRLLSEQDALSAIDTLERDTGRTFDRSLATRSFKGIPIRAGIGARVAVTDQTGQTTKGTITQLSASSLALGGSAGAAQVYDETSLRKIRLLYSPKHDALVGFTLGVGMGAVTGVLAGALGDENVVGTAVAAAGLLGGLVAAIGMTTGALHYPFNSAYDVYSSDGKGAFRTSAIMIAPQVAQGRKGVLVSVRF